MHKVIKKGKRGTCSKIMMNKIHGLLKSDTNNLKSLKPHRLKLGTKQIEILILLLRAIDLWAIKKKKNREDKCRGSRIMHE